MTDRQAIRGEATHLAECMTDGGWEGREMEKLARQVLALLDELNAPRWSIVNMAVHPTKPSRPLPRSRWRRALLVLRGYELYGP